MAHSAKVIGSLSAAVLALIGVGLSSARAQNFSNPVQHYADPFITYYNGFYYSSGTLGDRIAIYKSDTIPGLLAAQPVTVYTPSPGTQNCCGLWSPELHNVNGTWFIYYTADNGSGTKYDFVLQGTSPDPQASFNDIGQMDCGGACDDPHVFQDTNSGNWYFLSAGLDPRTIKIQQMSGDGHTLFGDRRILVVADQRFENGVVEGPRVIQNAGKTFLTYAADYASTVSYKTGMTINTNGNLMDPGSWNKLGDPVFQQYQGGDGAVYGPGRLSFTTSRDGSQNWVIYHAKTDNGDNYNRDTRAQRFYFDGNGVPQFGHPIPSGVLQDAPSGDAQAGPGIASGGIYALVNLNSQFTIDVPNGSSDTSTLLQQWYGNGLPPQHWTFNDQGGGYFRLINQQNGLCMDLPGGSTTAGQQIGQFNCNSLPPQNWQFIYWGNGYYKATNQQSGLALDVNGGSTAAGAAVQQWYDNGLAPQRWRLDRVQ